MSITVLYGVTHVPVQPLHRELLDNNFGIDRNAES